MEDKIEIYIRPLRMGDHLVAYHWRNNPEVWKYTGSRPDIVVTEQIEAEWLERVLKQTDAMRYAICIKDTDEYIGNVTLTGIKDGVAEYHTHIGEMKYWGKGLSSVATKMMIQKGFDSGINEMHVTINKNNVQSIKMCSNAGFSITGEDEENVTMTIKKPTA